MYSYNRKNGGGRERGKLRGLKRIGKNPDTVTRFVEYWRILSQHSSDSSL